MKELQFGPEPMCLVVEWTSDGEKIQAEQNLTIQHRKENDMAQTQFKFDPNKSEEGCYTNGERAAFGMEAVNAWDAATKRHTDDVETMIAYLMSDLLHLCDRDGLDYNAVLRQAVSNHQEER